MVITVQERTSAAARSFVICGNELSRKGRYEAAEELYQRALMLVEKTLGKFHPVMAEVLESYADLLARTHRHTEAIVMNDRADAVWAAYSTCFDRSYEDSQPYSLCRQEPEGSD